MTGANNHGPLEGFHVVCLGVNMPAAATAARLAGMGAQVTKIEPPGGDPLAQDLPDWYETLVDGHRVISINLKDPDGREHLEEILAATDILITANRPSALRRLQLDPPDVAQRHKRLLQVGIVGHHAPYDEIVGHDLTYQASIGLVDPPTLPRTLIADLAGVERAVSAALALVIARERGIDENERMAVVALEDAAEVFAEPLRRGLTKPGGRLGGGSPFYGIYRTKAGWLAVAALEPHFQTRLLEQLELDDVSGLADRLLTRNATDWQQWAEEHVLPLRAVATASEDGSPAPVDRKHLAGGDESRGSGGTTHDSTSDAIDGTPSTRL